jgi:RNA polymerase sigma-70 factor (ECF subfamily)
MDPTDTILSTGELWAQARAAWPDLRVTEAQFASFLAERPGQFEPARLADLYLVCACLAGNAQAIAAFETRYIAGTAAVVGRMKLDAATLDEVTQRLRTALFVPTDDRRAKLAEYSGRGDLGAWMRAVTIRVALNTVRRAKPAASLDDVANTLVVEEDPELAYTRRLYGEEIRTAVRLALATLSPRERNLLRHHYLRQLTLDQLAALHGVHRATVARWLQAAREQVTDETRRALKTRLNVGPTELSSILRMVDSDLAVSIRGLIGETSEA